MGELKPEITVQEAVRLDRRAPYAACGALAIESFLPLVASALGVVLFGTLRASYIAGQVLAALFAICLCLLARRKFGCGLGRGTDAYGMFLGVGTMVCFYPSALLVSELSATLAPDLELQTAVTSVGAQFGPAVLWLLLALLPAVSEELLLRGVVFGSFRRYGFPVAMAVSAIGFAALHGSVHQAAYTLFLGVIWAFLREATGSAVPGMIAHLAFNTAGVLAMVQPAKGSGAPVPGALNSHWALAGLAAVMAFIGAWVLHAAGKRYRALGVCEPAPSKPGAPVFVCAAAACAVNIGMTVFINSI